jgi:hypothetical protein
MSESKGLPPVLTRDAALDQKAWPHLRILYIIMDKHAYWRENRINKFTQDELAKECGVGRVQINRTLKYLHEHNIIFSKGPHKYINPRYCYKCGPEVLAELFENLGKENEYFVGTEKRKLPSLWPKFNFKKVKPATQSEDQEYIAQQMSEQYDLIARIKKDFPYDQEND